MLYSYGWIDDYVENDYAFMSTIDALCNRGLMIFDATSMAWWHYAGCRGQPDLSRLYMTFIYRITIASYKNMTMVDSHCSMLYFGKMSLV